MSGAGPPGSTFIHGAQSGGLAGPPASPHPEPWLQTYPEAAGWAGGFSAAGPAVPPAAAGSSPRGLATGWPRNSPPKSEPLCSPEGRKHREEVVLPHPAQPSLHWRQQPEPYLLEGGRPAAPTEIWPLEAAARSSLARSRAFFRDKAWLSQSSSSFSADAPGWEGRLALAGGSAPSGGGCAPEERGSPAGAERGPGAEGCLSGWGREGAGNAEPLLRGSLVGEGGSRSSSSSLRPNQSAPPFLGTVGLVVAGAACLEPGSPLRSMPSSAKNLLQDREEGV